LRLGKRADNDGRVKFLCLLVWLFASARLPVLAIEKTDPIDTNRPSFCQSGIVVPRGTLQLENGSQYQHLQHGGDYFDIPETEVRIGATRRLELQMFVPQYVLVHGPSQSFEGASGLNEVGLKTQLIDREHLSASLVTAVNIPSGMRRISGSVAQPVLRLPYSIHLGKRWAVCGMQSLIINGPGGEVQWQPFAMVTRSLSPTSSAFAEYAGFFTQNSHRPSFQVAHFGAVKNIKTYHQVDAHFGFGLNRSSPSAFVGVGYSFRIN